MEQFNQKQNNGLPIDNLTRRKKTTNNGIFTTENFIRNSICCKLAVNIGERRGTFKYEEKYKDKDKDIMRTHIRELTILVDIEEKRRSARVSPIFPTFSLGFSLQDI